jgi:hypothetical protein
MSPATRGVPARKADPTRPRRRRTQRKYVIRTGATAKRAVPVRLLGVHPGPLLYTKVFLRLEPLGLELVAEAVRRAGHAVRIIDLQVEDHPAYFRLLDGWRPDVVAFPCNYLANVPEIVDLAKVTKARFPRTYVCVGGHSASFTATALIEHGAGAIDCVLKGEGEAAIPLLLAALDAGDGIASVRRRHRHVRGPAPRLCPLARRAEAGPRPAAPSAEIFSRHSRPLRLDRVLARLPVGLLVLQRLDLLRPQLPAGQARVRHRGSALDPRARRLHCRRRCVHSRAPRHGDRRGDHPDRHPQAVLPRDPRRRAVAEQRGIPPVEAHRPQDDVSRPRGDRRRGVAQIP